MFQINAHEYSTSFYIGQTNQIIIILKKVTSLINSGLLITNLNAKLSFTGQFLRKM